MMKHLIVFVFVLFGSMAISLASDFKLNQESLETKFDNSVEVSIENFSYFSLQDIKSLQRGPLIKILRVYFQYVAVLLECIVFIWGI
jgi:hypothetical protein